MKKFLLAPLLFLIPFLSHSQVEFYGMRVGESLEITKKNFIAKGFVQKSSQGNVITWEGTFGGKTGKIYTVSTPKSKLVWKFLVVAETHTDWYDTKLALNKYIEIFTKKYGAHSDQYFYFRKPYYEGDGYEHNAISLGYAEISSIYTFQDGNVVSLEITKELSVKITYQNTRLAEIAVNKNKQKNSNDY